MQIDDGKAERAGASLAALNARIARLAMALEVALDDQSALQALMATPLDKVSSVSESGSFQTSGVPPEHPTSEHRKAHQLEELRGLLMLRYHWESNSVNDNGLVLTRQMLLDVEVQLARQGFKPGADGLVLDHLFNIH